MRVAAIIFALACLAGCSEPAADAHHSLELDILDDLTVVFVQPGFTLQPVECERVTFERWTPTMIVEEKGIWIMRREDVDADK